ncbi:TPA: trp operon leader peptide [Escherichia coli]|nr:trp operon leader peptide [Escherichia coli]EHH8683142.1 trp operon leader peptide [Escherichia coli]MCN3425897.1 trp operon leader peptide [Escherichia coli]MCT9802619.1 trp operon leader peptide [Escherichia coli]HCN3769574.1 trp operon leader peptide [Escherichia coli]HDN1404561.1 trp operon leader peptide [Escherichia coli]
MKAFFVLKGWWRTS